MKRRLLSLLLAGIMMLSMPLMASAIESTPPGETGAGSSLGATPGKPTVGETTGWEAIEKMLETLGANNVFTIDMNGSTAVPGSFLDAFAGRDAAVIFEMGSGFSWTLRGEDMDPDVAHEELDLGVSADDNLFPEEALGGRDGIDEIQIHLSQYGKLPFWLELTVTLHLEYVGCWANAYWFNDGLYSLYNGAVVYDFCDSSIIDADAQATFRFNFAADLLLMITEDNRSPIDWENPFTDVNENDWFYGDVGYAYERGLMTGISATAFSPRAPMTRAMFVTVLWRLEDEPIVEEAAMHADFADTAQGAYYENAIGWAVKNEIVSGYGEGFFGPDDPMTREQMVTLLWRYVQHLGMDVSVGEDTNILSYNDAFDISEYAMSAMQWACGDGIIEGKPGELLDPKGLATRAEVAAVLHVFAEMYVA